MPRGGARLGAGRPKKGSVKVRPVVPLDAPTSPPAASSRVSVPRVEADDKLPLEYMVAVMNDPDADELRRDRMAVAAAPFLHAKSGETGKKGERQAAAAKVAAGKFAPAAPPRLVVNNAK